MNGILFIDFKLVACDFLKFDWCKMLNGYADFSFNIFSLRMTVVSVKTLQKSSVVFVFRNETNKNSWSVKIQAVCKTISILTLRKEQILLTVLKNIF